MEPMTSEQMLVMADAMRIAWEGSATEQPDILNLFEDGAPYLTIWDNNRCKCTKGHILKNLYNVAGQRRTAQAFLCTMPGDSDEEGIDVVNVHAPSGTVKLTDIQRRHLIRNLLQSSSMTRASRTIGEGKFVIGGDMNTDSILLGQIVDDHTKEGIIKTTVGVWMPIDARHGDICVVGGFTPFLVQRKGARNHDPQHHMASSGENNHSMLQSSC